MKKTWLILGLLVMGACSSLERATASSSDEPEKYTPSAFERHN